MSNYFTESKFCLQKAYGGYCNQVRALGLQPITYCDFQQEYYKLLNENKKSRNKKLIEITRERN